MADSNTPNYNFTLPEEGASAGTWGVKLNANWSEIDTGLFGVQTQVNAVNDKVDKVIPQTGGGALTALRINEIRDGNTGYTLPLANSVLVNQIITITLPDEFKTNEPVVTRAGSDTISYSGGTDTSLTFDSGSSVSITLTSDGVSDWGL